MTGTWHIMGRLQINDDSRYIFRILLLEICILISRCMHTQSLQLCPTLCDPMDCSLLGSFVHGIFPARILEWFAKPSSRGSSQLTERICLQRRRCKDAGSISGSGRSPGIENSTLLQYSCWKNSMDRGSLWATVHGLTKSRMQPSTGFSFS